MSVFEITGGIPLHGEVEVSGAKNAALPMMAACLLTKDPLRLHRVPRTADIETMGRLLQQLGVRVTWIEPHTVELQTVDEQIHSVPDDCIQAMRASVCALGPLLARRRALHFSKPGGDRIGKRPIDIHLKGLRALGGKLVETDAAVTGSARALIGAEVDLAGPCGSSVLGTATAMTAAALATGRSVIHHAAREPEVCELAGLLNQMGAHISGIGSDRLVIDGVRELHGADFDVIPDRIEAGTFLVAAAITGGDLLVRGARADHLAAVIQTLEKMGVIVTVQNDGIRARANGRLRATEIVTAPHPGFPTDMQAQVMALMCLAEGTSSVTEGIYPGRFHHVAELARMGARIHREEARAAITGTGRFLCAEVTSTDIRASAALVLAGLAAEGTSTIRDIEHIDRGYEQIEEKLMKLGANIRRV